MTQPSPIRRSLLVAVVATVLALLATVSPAVPAPSLPAALGGAGGEAPADRLRLLEQTSWVQPTGELRMRLGIDRPAPGATLSVALHTRLDERTEFDESLGGTLGDLFNEGPTVPLEGVAPPPEQFPGWQVAINPDSTVDIVLAVRPGAADDGASRARIPQAGVYPLAVTLEDAGGSVIDQLITYLVRVPEPDEEGVPLHFSLVVPLHAPPALQPDGTVALAPDELERLGSTVAQLADHPDVALDVQPTPETIAALAALDDPAAIETTERLVGALDDRQLVGAPYVDLALSSWVEAALDEPLTQQFTSGDEQLETTLQASPDGRTWIAAPTITPEALTTLRELGVDQVVLPEAILGPLDPDDFEHSLTQTFDVINSEGDRQRAIMADTGLSARVRATGDPVLDAHRLLADLSVLYFDDPELARGAVVALEKDVPIDPTFLDTLLTALETPTIVTAATLDTLFADTTDAFIGGDDVESGEVLIRGFAPQPSPPLGTYPDALARTQEQVAGYRSMLPPDPLVVDPLDPLQAFELVSGADGLTGTERQAYLDAVTAQIDAQVAAIHIDQQAVTLTDREGVIPLSVRNDLDQPVTIRVVVESEKLELPEGSELVEVVEPGVTTLEVPVEARASGAFPVDIRVTSPDGILALSEGRVTVRSTAVSGLGVVLSVIAALFLLLWWARHFRSVRRANRLVSTRHPAAQLRAREAQQQFIEEITKH